MNQSPLLLDCQSISKAFGATPLFSGISLTISVGERLGFIGPNGSGKSTFLRILAGQIQTDSGEISTKKNIKVEYLPQQDHLNSENTIEQVLADQLKTENLEEKEIYSRIRRWTARAKFKDGSQLVESLSGGWRKRLSIVSSMITEPDLLLLDEPTNHLDIEGICWLEDLLKEPDFSFVLVTHDRYFLENVTNRMVELNRRFSKGFLKVEGSYSDYLIHREALLDNQLQLETVLANKLRRETEWLSRGPKARATKARFRIEEAYKLRDDHSSLRSRNLSGQSVGFNFEGTNRRTKKLIEAVEISKEIGKQQLFKKLSLILSPKSCLGLLGRNGTGKSTLISILAGSVQPDEGTVKHADGLKITVFDQKREQLNQQQSLREALAPTGDSVVYGDRSIHVISWAKRFLFEPEKLELPVSQLSGGEQSRILIARLMLQPADILLLDEPTNDLDIPSLEVLENSIAEFPGAVVLVTHDRFLLDRLATGIIGFDGQGNAGHFADYYQWLSVLKTQAVQAKDEKQKVYKQKEKSRKLTYKEQLELEKIEGEILKAEQELGSCQKRIETPTVIADPEKLQECCSALQKAQETVEELYERWETLEAIKSQQ
ncbi:ABC-F family ATP-binding cassette domain-containing protein [bacterium]|nr:ABC-F family ATP-binding cassette domain-containing protein [bacterium]